MKQFNGYDKITLENEKMNTMLGNILAENEKPRFRIGYMVKPLCAVAVAVLLVFGAAKINLGTQNNVEITVSPYDKGEPEPAIEITTEITTEATTEISTDIPAESKIPALIYPVADGHIGDGYGDVEGHEGVDFVASYGSDIMAMADGVVTMSEYYYGYGKCIIIDHDNGYQTLYAHCSELYAKVGDEVKQGDVIGAVGQTGWAYGNLVHIELRLDEEAIDPIEYFSEE